MRLKTWKGDSDNARKGLQGEGVCAWIDEGLNGECAV